MKSFSLIFLGLFCVFTLSAQEISEDKFIAQLETKHKELRDLINTKNGLDNTIAISEKIIQKITAKEDKTEEDKNALEEARKQKEKAEKSLVGTVEKIGKKCIEYKEFQVFITKYQNVSKDNIKPFEILDCVLFEPETKPEEVEEEVVEEVEEVEETEETDVSVASQAENDKADTVLAHEKELLDKIVQAKSDKEAEIFKNAKELKDAELEIISNPNDKESLKKLQGLKEKKKELEKADEKLLKDLVSSCEKFAALKKDFKENKGIDTAVLNKYEVNECSFYEAKEEEGVVVASAAENTNAKKELEKKEAAINTLIKSKQTHEQALLEAELVVKGLELKISKADEDDIKELTKELEKAQDAKKKIEENDKELLTQIRSSCKEFAAYKKFLKEKQGVKTATLDAFKAEKCELYEEKPKPESERFVIVGDNAPVKFDSLFSNSSARRVLGNVFSIDSRTNLGTFEIPGDKSFVNFYAQKKVSSFLGIIKNNNLEKVKFQKSLTNDKDSIEYNDESYAISIRQYKLQQGIPPNSSNEELQFFGEVPEGALFKSIQIELREGGIVDTRLILHSLDGKFEFYFEGTAPVSILHYTRKASKRSFLKYSHYISLDGKGVYNENALKRLLVRYTDVLDYKPNAGSNYVPDDVSYKFPSEAEAEETGRRSYEVINNNHLQNVLDLRAYTDLLGLFGDEANGLFQIEGKADFFIHPFNFPRTALYYFKKVSPYVRYSRFDEDNDFVQSELRENIVYTIDPVTMDTISSQTITNYSLSNSKLSLLERSNLEMGLDINLLNFRLFKESPFWTSVYFPLSYNVTKVRTDAMVEDNDANYRTLGFGFGLDLEIRRFNNFGLNVGYELKGHSFIGDYSEFDLIEPGYLKTQAVKAEIFYYPGIDRSNSVFLRMKSVRDIGSGGGDNFFQLQFGYRFTLGVGAIRARQ